MKSRALIFYTLLISSCLGALNNYAQNATIKFNIQEQNKLDSLNSLINNNQTHDSIKVNAILEIANYYYLKHPDTAIVICKRAEYLSEKINYKKGIADSYSWLGFLIDQKGDIDQALDYHHKSLKLNEAINDKNGIGLSLNNLGFIYDKKGDVIKALKYLHQSLKIKEEGNEKTGIASSLNNLGYIYKRQGDTTQALLCYRRSLSLRTEMNDKKGIAMSLNNIGFVYLNADQDSLALSYFQSSLKIQEEINDKKGFANSLNNIGLVFDRKGDLNKALQYYQKSLTIRKEINEKEAVAISLNSIANLMLNIGRTQEAIENAQQSLKLSQELGFPSNIKNAAYTLKKIFLKTSNYKEAFRMLELQVIMQDSIDNEAVKKASIRSMFQYEYEKKNAADSIKNIEESKVKDARLIAQRAEIKSEKTKRYGLFGGLALVLVFTGFLFNRFRVTSIQKKVIQNQKEIVEYQKKEVENQKGLLEEKNKNIMDSIHYAKRIQEALLKEEGVIINNLPDHFILFKPKDIVSGDFYWGHEKEFVNENGNKVKSFCIAAADCTGHGVPGAFLTMLGTSFLNEINSTQNNFKPATILDQLRNRFIRELSQTGAQGESKDGMDISLVHLEFTSELKVRLTWAGANNSLYIIRDNQTQETLNDKNRCDFELQEIKPNKQPIGYSDHLVPFTNVSIELTKGDSFYMFTDGYADQFGGEKGKKYMYSRFKQTILSICNLKMQMQKEKLETEFNAWKGSQDQVDDVCIIGVRI